MSLSHAPPAAAGAPTPDAPSLWRDWALFTASSAPRGGLLGRTSSIQRMDTAGGRGPGGSCTQGREARVPFRATYYFYRPGK